MMGSVTLNHRNVILLNERPAEAAGRYVLYWMQHSQRAGEQTLILHHPVLLEEDQVVDLVAQSIQRVMDYYTRHDGGP